MDVVVAVCVVVVVVVVVVHFVVLNVVFSVFSYVWNSRRQEASELSQAALKSDPANVGGTSKELVLKLTKFILSSARSPPPLPHSPTRI